MDAIALGRIAYNAYCEATGGRSLVSGAELPGFDGLRGEIKLAWAVAANAVYAQALEEAKEIIRQI